MISINTVHDNITMYLIGKFLDASLIFTDSFNGVAALPLLKFDFSFKLPHLNKTNVLKHLNETNVLKHLNETNVLKHLNETNVLKHLNETNVLKHLNEKE